MTLNSTIQYFRVIAVVPKTWQASRMLGVVVSQFSALGNMYHNALTGEHSLCRWFWVLDGYHLIFLDSNWWMIDDWSWLEFINTSQLWWSSFLNPGYHNKKWRCILCLLSEVNCSTNIIRREVKKCGCGIYGFGWRSSSVSVFAQTWTIIVFGGVLYFQSIWSLLFYD